ncbi:unnamed protein product [Penicillium roqueforti FM164]|uniref:Genomic scaffold, ProqFM164S03 n=1 Tax=Penicillium roqueforti (strain FM164) TaxID=1365484 RepID=W6QEF1_PENRF|nr:unnamed protein product [Penicillium roqueforti FM164]
MCQRGLEVARIAVEAGRNIADSFPLVVIASLIGSGVTETPENLLDRNLAESVVTAAPQSNSR